MRIQPRSAYMPQIPHSPFHSLLYAAAMLFILGVYSEEFTPRATCVVAWRESINTKNAGSPNAAFNDLRIIYCAHRCAAIVCRDEPVSGIPKLLPNCDTSRQWVLTKLGLPHTWHIMASNKAICKLGNLLPLREKGLFGWSCHVCRRGVIPAEPSENRSQSVTKTSFDGGYVEPGLKYNQLSDDERPILKFYVSDMAMQADRTFVSEKHYAQMTDRGREQIRSEIKISVLPKNDPDTRDTLERFENDIAEHCDRCGKIVWDPRHPGPRSDNSNLRRWAYSWRILCTGNVEKYIRGMLPDPLSDCWEYGYASPDSGRNIGCNCPRHASTNSEATWDYARVMPTMTTVSFDQDDLTVMVSRRCY